MKNIKKRVYLPGVVIIGLAIIAVVFVFRLGFFGVIMGEIDNGTPLKNEARMEAEERDLDVLVYEGYDLNSIKFETGYNTEPKKIYAKITTHNKNQELFIETFLYCLKIHYGSKMTINMEDRNKQEVIWNIFNIYFISKYLGMYYLGIPEDKDEATLWVVEWEDVSVGHDIASITHYKEEDKVEVFIYDSKIRQEFSEKVKEVLEKKIN